MSNKDQTSKLWGGRFSEATDQFVQRFTASVNFDQRMAPQDIQGSLAHAAMLHSIGVLSEQELQDIESGLGTILEEVNAGTFAWSIALEDVHMNIEARLTELIGNAGKYTPKGGHVDVTLEVAERCVQVAVADTGIGIAPEDQSHVFEKFYRATNDEVQMVTGTGLGLAIAREVARLHGGDIRLESEPAKGSTFVVELPHCGTDG